MYYEGDKVKVDENGDILDMRREMRDACKWRNHLD